MKKLVVVLGLLYSTSSLALNPNIMLDGTVPSEVTVYPERDKTKSIHTNKKEVVLLKINLSTKAKANLADILSYNLKHPYTPSADASRVQLGMNGTPTLDQGRHGSCVTFATTAALDAVLGLGHYISQLCNLELGSYLHNQDNSYYSGWDGSWGEVVIDQIQKYGFINVPSQVVKGCSGYHIYPNTNAEDRGNPMPTADFTARSEFLPHSVSFERILGVNDALTAQSNGEHALARTKSALQAGNRVLIATITSVTLGEAGAQGKFAYPNDSYILTSELEKQAKQGLIYGAHELVVIGYDDKATITDTNGNKHYGVIKLRNSWGYTVGDWGDIYMSYDYFKTFVFDAIAVKK